MIDDIYREWYERIEGKNSIPENYAIHGSFSSCCLWVVEIYIVLLNIVGENTTQENCIFIKYTDKGPISYLC